jgi:hypothetical protein
MLATHNGADFDLPLLCTHWVLARMPGELEHPAHTDLLALTRALFGPRAESCGLRQVEGRLLGVERERDLPGRPISPTSATAGARCWSSLLPLALHHNRQDVVSFHHLHLRLRQRLSSRDPDTEGRDWFGRGPAALALGTPRRRPSRAATAAELADGPSSARAGLFLARQLAGRPRHTAAERLLAALQERLPGDTALAGARPRLLEWRLGHPVGARRVVAAVLAGPAGRGRGADELERRLARLEMRLSRPPRPGALAYTPRPCPARG